jgi:3-phenylpropionate/trans-cinnamate dioxygenase ferredoxin reductase subunit
MGVVARTGGPDGVVVAGAGLAGLRTVEELRGRGYPGPVTLVGAERRLPYDRPPLSKQLMAGKLDDTTLRDDLAPLDIELRLGETAEAVGEHVLYTDRGEYRFGALVITTGSVPVTLPGPGRQRVLRTLDDALGLREVLRPGLRLAIAGAGWIGAEIATAAAGRGCRVTVVEAGPAPLAAALGTRAGAATAGWYAEAGVDLRLGEAVASVEPGGLALASGGFIEAGEIVTAVGVRPATGWLTGSAVALGNGVTVDEYLRASVPGIYAAGDCAAFWSRRYRRRLRVEHWDNALRAPATVAAGLLGGGEAYDPVPYIWSEQFGRMVQYAGYHQPEAEVHWRGGPGSGSWAACWVADRRLAAILTVNAPRELMAGRRLIASGAEVDIAVLADPRRPLREAAAG